MNQINLFEELIEDKELDMNIVKSFKTKDSLSKDIFDDSMSMNNDVRKQLLGVSHNFIESLGVEFFIHDVVLTGSLANYNWSSFSDVDLHILIDMDEIAGETNIFHDIVKEFFDSKKNVWNSKHNIKIKEFDVEIYVQDVNEAHVSSGVYSVLHDKWIVIPQKDKLDIDRRKIIERGEEFSQKIDNLIDKSNHGEDVIKGIEELRLKLKRFRQSGLDEGGEFSYENLTFKLLRRNGYIQKLLDLKTKIIDKKLSITQ